MASPDPQDKPEREQQDNEDAAPASLVPIYGGTDIVPGIQALRRGDAILYTVRGEPEAVRELMGQLDKEGVHEVIALISHHVEEEDKEADVEEPQGRG